VGRITVIVSPGAKRTEIVDRQGDAWKLRLGVAMRTKRFAAFSRTRFRWTNEMSQSSRGVAPA
jgi:hypothetical protein